MIASAGDRPGGVVATAGGGGVGRVARRCAVGDVVGGVGGDQRQCRVVDVAGGVRGGGACVGWRGVLVAFGGQAGEDAFDGVVGGACLADEGGSPGCGVSVLVGGVDDLADAGFQIWWWAGGCVGVRVGHWWSPRWARAWAGEALGPVVLVGRRGWRWRDPVEWRLAVCSPGMSWACVVALVSGAR